MYRVLLAILLTFSLLAFPLFSQTFVHFEDFENYTGNPSTIGWFGANNQDFGVFTPSTTSDGSWTSDDFGNDPTISGKSARFNFWGTFSSDTDWLISPMIGISTLSNPILVFDIAVTPFSGTSPDSIPVGDTLFVVVSTDDSTWDRTNIIATYTHDDFFPPTGTQIVLPLTAYAGFDSLSIAFVAQDPAGPGDINVYIDNFGVGEFANVDMAVTSFVNLPGAVLQGSTVNFGVEVSNVGLDTVFADTLDLFYDGALVNSVGFGPIAPGTNDTLNVSFAATASQVEVFKEVKANLRLIAGDADPSNDTLTAHINVTSTIPLPFVEQWDSTMFNSEVWVEVSGSAEIIDSTGVATGTFPHPVPSDPFFLDMKGGNSIVASGFFDLSGMSSVVLQMFESEHDLEIGESVFLEYLASDGTWKLLHEFAGTNQGFGNYLPFSQQTFSLPADAYHSEFRFRWRTSSSMSNFDEWFFDDIELKVLVVHDLAVVSASTDACQALNQPNMVTAIVSNLGNQVETDVPVELFENGSMVGQVLVTLNPGESDTLDIPYTPSVLGPVTLDVVAMAPGDANPGNDSSSVSIQVFPQGSTFSTLFLTSGLVNKPISDAFVTEDTLTVTDDVLICDMEVIIDSLTHTFDADLDIYLIGPNGDTLELSTDNGGSGDNYIGTIFDDQAPIPITAGAPPFTGAFQPEGFPPGFGMWTNTSAMGDWILHIEDDFSGDDGTLHQWSIMITAVQLPTPPPLVKFEETFNDTTPPPGWIVVDNDGSGDSWDFVQGLDFGGGQVVNPQAGQSFWWGAFGDANASGLIDEWLISPQIQGIEEGDVLSFYAGAVGGNFPDSLKVWVSTTDTSLSSFTEIAYFEVPGPIGSWTKFEFDLTPFAGNDIYVAVNYYIVDGGPFGNNSDNVWVDHFMVRRGTIREFFASLDGYQAVPQTGSPGYGSGYFVLSQDSSELYYQIVVSNLVGNLTAAHFHNGAMGLTGPVVKPITFVGDTAQGVWSSLDPDYPLTPALLQELLNGNIYVNVLTDSFPAGEIRGQVLDTMLMIPNAPQNLNAQAATSNVDLWWDPPLPTGVSEIKYDQDPDQGVGFSATGELAVRFTPTKYPARLLAIRAYWVDIGGALDNVEYSVWDDPNGLDQGPVNQILANTPYTVPARNAFSDIIISDQNLSIASGDFYYSLIQPDTINYGLGWDTDGPDAGRSWASFDGGATWTKLSDLGFPFNVVIRALVLEGTGSEARIVELEPAEMGGRARKPADIKALHQRFGHLLDIRSPQSFKPTNPELHTLMQFTEGLLGFNIYRSTDNVNFNLLTSVDAATLAYSDGSVNPGTTYYYYVTADYDFGESNPSNTVTATPGFTPEPLMNLVHTPGDLNVAIFNDGSIGADNQNFTGPGVTWKGQNGIFVGGPIFGTAAVGSVNGLIGSFNIFGDLVNLGSNFAGGFTSEPNFDQVTQAILDDSGAPVPYGVRIIQKSYSNTGENFVIIRYGFINTTTQPLTDFYAGAFVDWDVDASTFGSNLGGYDVARNLVYTFDTSGTPYFYGIAVLDGLAGYRSTTETPSPTVRQGSFQFISTPDPSTPTNAGDYRNWQGTGPITINPGDTAWVTIAVVAGDDLPGIQANADSACTKSAMVGFTNCQPVGIEPLTQAIPDAFALYANYPNPFNPTTTIRYDLKESVDVKLEIYNVLGEKVRTLVNAREAAGRKSVVWDGRNDRGQVVSSGIYIYRLQAGDFVQSRKMMLLK
ncbi:MAG: CHRD domain-containing protein [Calditrichaeota bacterium]|nr:MAG: CHRD domain-containing protein [Calditrichota bacterium]